MRFSALWSSLLLPLCVYSCASDNGPQFTNTLPETQEIIVDESLTLPLSGSAITLIKNTNQLVADVSVKGNTLQIHGKAYGVAEVQLQVGQAKKSIQVGVFGPRPKMPTERFAPFSLAPDGQHLALSHKFADIGYFAFEDVQHLSLSYQGHTYRIPTNDELSSLFSYNEMAYGRKSIQPGVGEVANVDGVPRHYEETLYSGGQNVLYAIRFAKHHNSGVDKNGIPYATDNHMRMAFRYEYSVDPDNPKAHRLLITTRYLGEYFLGNMSYVANEGFWASFRKDDRSIVFEATGTKNGDDAPVLLGEVGEYWSATPSQDVLSAWVAGFSKYSATKTLHGDRGIKRAVRLIEAQ